MMPLILTLIRGKVLSITEIFEPVDVTSCAITVALDDQEWKDLTEADPEAKNHLEKARIRVKGYKIYGGLLYFENRLFVPSPKRADLLAEAHSDYPDSHGGLRATLERLSKLWWPSMSNDAYSFVESCEVCRSRKAERKLPTGTMNSFAAYEPFKKVACDTLAPITSSLSGKQHVMVAICCFTKFVDATASDNIQGETFSRFLANYIGRYGSPKTVLTDNATTCCNRNVKELLAKYKIIHKFSTPHHHQGNAMVERVIQSLPEKLSLITHDPVSSMDWEEALPHAILSLNTSYHKSMGYSPFELLFGRRLNFRSELIIDEYSNLDGYVELRNWGVGDARNNAIALQYDSRIANKNYYDRRHRELTFEIGDLVLAQVVDRRSKLQNRFVPTPPSNTS